MGTIVAGWGGNEADVVAETDGDAEGNGAGDGEDDTGVVD